MWVKAISLGILLTVISSIIYTRIGPVSSLSFIALLAIILLGYGYAITQLVTQPIKELNNLLKQLKNGQLDTPILAKYDGVVGELYHNISELTDVSINHIFELEQDLTVLSLIFGQLNDGVIVTNPAGEITLVNDSALNMFDQKYPYPQQRIADLVRHHEIIELWQRCVQTKQFQSNVKQK